jgi:ribosomal protein S18 acetylase RimI-like enzyme
MRTRALYECSSRDLRPLLQEECLHWGRELCWDFREVSSAVAGGLDHGALVGRVAQDGRRTLAYCYALAEKNRFVVGSLFATLEARGHGLEEDLLRGVLADAQARRDYDRVECQTLFSTAAQPERPFVQAGFWSQRRHYLVRDLRRPLPRVVTTFRLRPFRREDVPLAAQLVHRSHVGSLDAAFNQSYSTPALCRGVVETLVERGGCGPFDAPSSLVAESRLGTPVGLILASRLSPRSGHICQVSVVPEAQGCGLGSVLVIGALAAFRLAGRESVSLSVTVDNRRAYRLYLALGFEVRKEFAAHAWVRPPARLAVPA